MSQVSKHIHPAPRKDESLSTRSVDSQALSDEPDTVQNTRRAQNPRTAFLNTRSGGHKVKAVGGSSSGNAHRNVENDNDEEKKQILANRYKTKLCKNYVATGACPYEARCMFAHGDAELRTAEQNIADGLTSEEAIKAFQHPHSRRFNGGSGSASRRHNNNNNNTSRVASRAAAAKREDAAIVSAVPVTDAANAAFYNEEDSAMTPAAADSLASNTNGGSEDYYYYGNGNANVNGMNYRSYYVYSHNPYALDLLAPEDRLYTTPYVPNAMAAPAAPMDYVESSCQNDYFPMEEMEDESNFANLNSNNTYYGSNSFTNTVGAGGCAACSAVEMDEFHHGGQREMILEP